MINKLSHIHENSILGKNVKIDGFTVIYDVVEMGDNCWIGPDVTILPGARIGKKAKIYPGAVISADPQDKIQTKQNFNYNWRQYYYKRMCNNQ